MKIRLTDRNAPPRIALPRASWTAAAVALLALSGCYYYPYGYYPYGYSPYTTTTVAASSTRVVTPVDNASPYAPPRGVQPPPPVATQTYVAPAQAPVYAMSNYYNYPAYSAWPAYYDAWPGWWGGWGWGGGWCCGAVGVGFHWGGGHGHWHR
ncbi:hypothetical protein [Paraburkholderia phosphatilytica]|uniref:hypothetical protein n=1 Tax=Paraburkholderia phosphatilytica TaxID=2282883 RepID=UPI0013DFC6AA|nr:hypothetical protein [Paraburkholderia phosphatilytica]